MSMDGTPIQNSGSHKASFSLSGVTGNKAQTLGTFLNRKVTALPGEKVSRVIIPINDTPSITIRDTMGKPQTLKNLNERKVEKLDDSKAENSQRYQTLQLALKYGQFTSLSLEAAPVKGGKEQELFVTLNVNEVLKKLKDSQLKTLTLPPPEGKGYTEKEADFLARKGLDWAAECFHESPKQLEYKYKTWIQNAPNRADNPSIHKRFSRSDSGYGGSSRSNHEIERPQSPQHAPGSFLSEERKADIEGWVKSIVPPDPGDLPIGRPGAVKSENKIPENDKGPLAKGSARSRPSQHSDIFEEDDDDVLSQLFSEDGQAATQDEAKDVNLEYSGFGSGDDYYHKGNYDEDVQLTGADRKGFGDLDDIKDWKTRSNLSEDSELFQAYTDTDSEDHDFTVKDTRRKEGGSSIPSEGIAGRVKAEGQKGSVPSQPLMEAEEGIPYGTADEKEYLDDELLFQKDMDEISDDQSVLSDTEIPEFEDFDDEQITEDQRAGTPMLAEDFEARRLGVKGDDEDDFEEETALEDRESPNTEPDLKEISPSSTGGIDETDVLTSLEPGAGEADEEGVSQSRESDGGKNNGESGEQSSDGSLTGKASSATESKETGEQVGRQPSTSGEGQVETDGQNPDFQAGTDEQETRDRVQAESEPPVMESGQPSQKNKANARDQLNHVPSSDYGQQTTLGKPKKSASTPTHQGTKKKTTTARKSRKPVQPNVNRPQAKAGRQKKATSTPTRQGIEKKTTAARNPNKQIKSKGYGQQTAADSKSKKARQSSSYGQETAASRAKKTTPTTTSKATGKNTSVQQTPPSEAKPKVKKPEAPAQRARIDKELERKDKELLGVSSIYNTADVKKMTLEKLLECATKPKNSRNVSGDSNNIVAAYNRHAIRNRGDTSPHYTGNTISNNIKVELNKLKLSETASRDEIAQALANSAIASFDQFRKDKNLIEHTKRLRALKELKDTTFKI